MAPKRADYIQIFYFLAALLGLLIVQEYLGGLGQDVQVLPYSQFQDMLHAGKLDILVVSHDRIQGTIKAPETGQPARFTTLRVDPSLAQSLTADHVTFSASPPPGWLITALSWLLPLGAFWAIWFLVGQRMASGVGKGMGIGGLMNIGRSRARVYAESDTKTRFRDMAGADEATPSDARREKSASNPTFETTGRANGRRAARQHPHGQFGGGGKGVRLVVRPTLRRQGGRATYHYTSVCSASASASSTSTPR